MTYQVNLAKMQDELEFLNRQLELGTIYGYSYTKNGSVVIFSVHVRNC